MAHRSPAWLMTSSRRVRFPRRVVPCFPTSLSSLLPPPPRFTPPSPTPPRPSSRYGTRATAACTSWSSTAPTGTRRARPPTAAHRLHASVPHGNTATAHSVCGPCAQKQKTGAGGWGHGLLAPRRLFCSVLLRPCISAIGPPARYKIARVHPGTDRKGFRGKWREVPPSPLPPLLPVLRSTPSSRHLIPSLPYFPVLTYFPPLSFVSSLSSLSSVLSPVSSLSRHNPPIVPRRSSTLAASSLRRNFATSFMVPPVPDLPFSTHTPCMMGAIMVAAVYCAGRPGASHTLVPTAAPHRHPRIPPPRLRR